MPFRAGSVAFLSSSSSDKATTMKTPATIPGNPGTPPPMKAARREVPLPSQEGKKGAMQYALYVGYGAWPWQLRPAIAKIGTGIGANEMAEPPLIK
jgi:hypothetical protein